MSFNTLSRSSRLRTRTLYTIKDISENLYWKKQLLHQKGKTRAGTNTASAPRYFCLDLWSGSMTPYSIRWRLRLNLSWRRKTVAKSFLDWKRALDNSRNFFLKISLMKLIGTCLWTIHLQSFEVIRALFHLALFWLSWTTFYETECLKWLLDIGEKKITKIKVNFNFILSWNFSWELWPGQKKSPEIVVFGNKKSVL